MGQQTFDFWYTQTGDVTYVYYLQAPIGTPPDVHVTTIGMATSRDLIHWTEYGEVLRAAPPGQWNDWFMATGSNWWYQDRWQMLFTGHTHTGERGIGLAESHDLKHWTRVGDGPVQINYQPFVVPQSAYWQGNGFAEGAVLTYLVLDDPYVLPEPVDGWYYMIADCLLDNEDIEKRGCIGMFRSHDGRVWDDMGLVAAPHVYAELEAPELWQHGGRWYLMFGTANINPFYRSEVVYTAPTMMGPFEPNPRSQLTLPDYSGWFYIAKVTPNPQGQDVLIGGAGGRLSRPYPVVYESDGALTLAPYDLTMTQWVPLGLTAYHGPVVSDLVGGVVSNGSYRLTLDGYRVWGPAGGLAASVWASDGLGGAVGAVSNAGDIYAGRTSVSGTLPWGPSVTVCSANQGQINPVIAGDGSGGAFLAWIDFRNGNDYDIYAQHLDAFGQRTWANNGVAACARPGAQLNPTLKPDGAGGVIVTWDDSRAGAVGGTDIYAQRFNSAGAPQWGTNGTAVCAAAGVQEAPVVETDGAGGAYIAWWDGRGTAPRDVYMQRLAPDGSPMWTPDGIPIADGFSDQVLPVLAPDGSHGVFMAWEDHREGADDGLDIYAQHVDPTGALLWPAGGAPVCVNPSQQTRPSIVLDGSGGVIIAWLDARNDTSTTSYFYVPYAQRLDSNGVPLWTQDGVRVEITQGTNTPIPPSIAPDGSGGLYVDGTNGLQRILPDGRLAWVPEFTPRIATVKDVPADQGGYVRLEIEAARAETSGVPPGIVGYEVWRKIPEPTAAQRGLSALAVGAAPRRLPSPLTSGPPTGWEILLSFLPTGSEVYTLSVPTLADSTDLDPADQTYAVTAHTSNPKLFLPSDEAQGHSVDNLAPGPPQSLSGSRTSETSLHLAWSPGRERDLWLYNVYRGPTATFTPSAGNRIGQPLATTFDDPAFVEGSYYKVTTLDRHGNESGASTLSPAQILGAGAAIVPAVTYLRDAAPNPSVGSTSFEYGLAHAGRVSLVVHDVAGRRVRTLVDGVVPEGVWHARWDGLDDRGHPVAAGQYYAHLVADDMKGTRKFILSP